MAKKINGNKSLSRREFLSKSAMGLGGVVAGSIWIPALGCSSKIPHVNADSKPNILIMVADDQGWRDVGFHGSEIKTPTLDKLANENVQLDQFYVCPTCSPTRASLLTGKYPSRFGILGPIGGKSTQALPTDATNIPNLLKQNGYATALTGKWHLGLTLETGPNHYGFDYTYGYLHGQVDQFTHVYKNGDRTWHRNGKFIDEKGHATDLITNEAIKYITDIRDKSKPFFLEVTFSVPHYPLQEEDKWIEPYKETIKNDSRRMFAASVAHLDYSVNLILETLKKEDLEKNTIVFFLSDNGGQENWLKPGKDYKGEHGPYDVLGDNRPLRDYKTSLYEGGIRVPSIVRWPGRLNAHKVDEVISVADILPTLAYLVGAKVTSEMNLDGKNVWSAIAEGGSTGKREIYGRTKNQIALRYDGWKLVHNGKTPAQGNDELYNLKVDPYEKNDVSKDHQDIVKSLLERMNKISESDVLADFPDADG
ncbi:MAG: sulfatase-like hydrolase/transferase [Melioribacteraceae bacterium]